MWQSVELCFPDDHPTAAGHFPSGPIMPGALLLDAVLMAVTGQTGDEGGVVIQIAKFFRFVRPGESVRVRWRSTGKGVIGFECRRIDDDAIAVAGTLAYRAVVP